MGIFDALFSGMETRTKLNPQESFAGILLAASACDGHISEEEFNGILVAIFRMKLFSRINEKEFHKVMNKLMGVLKKHGPEKLVEGCCENLPDDLRKSAFANACNIVLADGSVDPDEKEFINQVTRLLELDQAEAKTIAQVMVIKNKG
jgi:tellurite resistance protein